MKATGNAGTNPEEPPTTMIFFPTSLSADLTMLKIKVRKAQDRQRAEEMEYAVRANSRLKWEFVDEFEVGQEQMYYTRRLKRTIVRLIGVTRL